MRRSPLKKTPQKSRTISKSRFVQSTSTLRGSSSLYYCHYRNAMYMGGIKSFKKEGRGILLHDSGVSVLTSYYNDLMHGHNIFIDNYSLLSAIYNKNKVVEAVYRTEGFLVYLNYNNDRQLEGNIKLLNFVTKNIVYAFYKKGIMINKSEETDANLLSKIFQLNELEILIGMTHARVINYDFEKAETIQCQKHGNKIVVGFQKNGFINGLGFQFVFRGSQGGYNPDTHRQEDDFQLKVVERGYYMNTQLNGMGEKIFKNGNFYIGQFRNGIFQGNGILKNSQKKNWVSGYFKEGNLIELLEYSSEGASKGISKIVESMHERKTNWINYEVQLIDMNFYVDQIEKIISTVPNKQVQTLEQRKMEVLKKIQQRFITENNDSIGQNELERSVNQLNNNQGDSTISKFIHSFNPGEKGQNPNHLYTENKVTSNINEELRRQRKVFPEKKNPLSQTQMVQSGTHSPGRIKVKENLLSSSRKADERRTPTKKLQFSESRMSRGAYNPPQSSDRLSSSSRSGLDSKRMISKNKIFKYLQSQESRGSPQFTYTKVDTLREMERQR